MGNKSEILKNPPPTKINQTKIEKANKQIHE